MFRGLILWLMMKMMRRRLMGNRVVLEVGSLSRMIPGSSDDLADH
jgi:hypothetical protein